MGGRRAVDSCLVALAVAFSACGGGPRSLAFAPEPVSETMAPPAAMPRTAARPTSVSGKASSPTATSRAASSGTASNKKVPSRSAPAAARTPKIARVDSAALEFAVTARLAHEPLTRAIARRTRNPAMAERAAWAVTREAGRIRVSPSLLAAVLLIENRQLDSAAVSSQGAIGMMQVMPIHAGSYGCGSADLTSVDANICHGARILHLYLVRSRSVTVALRRYNGCVRGANTPRCSRYPVRVLQTAARLRRDILASATEADRHVRM
jgi:soluble lytic murein transglycosylase-like protein